VSKRRRCTDRDGASRVLREKLDLSYGAGHHQLNVAEMSTEGPRHWGGPRRRGATSAQRSCRTCARFWLTPKAGTEAFGRDGFSIHGGTAPGSAGCIDLTDEMDEFADLMQAIGQNDVAVEVDYGWLGSPNHRHKR
jgi:hypothetical protein